MGVLPNGASEYERGYSLDRLRDLTLVELTSPRAKESTHLYQSLAVLFRLVNEGHNGAPSADDAGAALEGLTFRNLKADLFDSEATALIDEVARDGRTAAGAPTPPAQQGGPRQGPWLHLVRRARN
ncbi:hypothetical protein [Georgenia sp. SUBG003]|uniref:hypothetical protein n=1 Tax=Georgenia sp. SUBG003 TaxID=1497974 RepID=UPI003AB90971